MATSEARNVLHPYLELQGALGGYGQIRNLRKLGEAHDVTDNVNGKYQRKIRRNQHAKGKRAKKHYMITQITLGVVSVDISTYVELTRQDCASRCCYSTT